MAVLREYASRWDCLPHLYYSEIHLERSARLLLMEDLSSSNYGYHHLNMHSNQVISFLARFHAKEHRLPPDAKEIQDMSERGIHSVRLDQRDPYGSNLPSFFSQMYLRCFHSQYTRSSPDSWGACTPSNVQNLAERFQSELDRIIERTKTTKTKWLEDEIAPRIAKVQSKVGWLPLFCECIAEAMERMHRTVIFQVLDVEKIWFINDQTRGDAPPIIEDWKSLSIGIGAIDLASVVIQTVIPHQRLLQEASWVRKYHRILNEHLFEHQVSLEEVEQGYRIGVFMAFIDATIQLAKRPGILARLQDRHSFRRALLAFLDHFPLFNLNST
eukprot:TRINITY_DN3568_c0_g1_i1.p1 TRINITY_DN3568_c0_g1~~TRINITY_DN3568_c0_g1_i1.p1  ORF type:complete len:367 (+),score=81.78 TRINITY_DN3568_c0_g1_i1:118-1101(+)